MSPNDDRPADRAVFFTHEFKRNIRQLARRYRRIQTDIQPVLMALEAGATPGDRITGVSVEVYKARVANSDRARGKSGGYRIIYQITAEQTVILITIYSKTDQSDITAQEIRDIILAYEQEKTAIDDKEEATNAQTPDDPPPTESVQLPDEGAP